jgi:hypothetical protein
MSINESGGDVMTQKKNFTDGFMSRIHDPIVEPVQRMVGGRFGWAIHRFPIAGGRSLVETVIRNSACDRRNPLFEKLSGGNNKT